MELLKGSDCSKVVILALVTITLVSPPDQCEAATCYKCPGQCTDATAKTEECTGALPCHTFTFKKADGSVRTQKGCNSPDDCFGQKLQFGLAEGCKEATGPKVKECGSAFQETDVLKYCTCAGDKCNGENAFVGGGGASGGGGSSKASSLKWTATEAGLMMASILIANGGL